MGIGGLQGSGASELFLGLFGAYSSHTSGVVQMDGWPARFPSPRKAIASNFSLLTNDRKATGLVLSMSVTAKAAGRENILFVGIDALPQEGVAYVQQGILDATFRYPTGGAEAIHAALKIFKGESVPKKMVLGTRLFDKSNVSDGGVALP